jgi:hypothetical protein
MLDSGAPFPIFGTAVCSVQPPHLLRPPPYRELADDPRLSRPDRPATSIVVCKDHLGGAQVFIALDYHSNIAAIF